MSSDTITSGRRSLYHTPNRAAVTPPQSQRRSGPIRRLTRSATRAALSAPPLPKRRVAPTTPQIPGIAGSSEGNVYKVEPPADAEPAPPSPVVNRSETQETTVNEIRVLDELKRTKRALESRKALLRTAREELAVAKEEVGEKQGEIEDLTARLECANVSKEQYRNWWINEVQFTKVILSKVPNANQDWDLGRKVWPRHGSRSGTSPGLIPKQRSERTATSGGICVCLDLARRCRRVRVPEVFEKLQEEVDDLISTSELEEVTPINPRLCNLGSALPLSTSVGVNSYTPKGVFRMEDNNVKSGVEVPQTSCKWGKSGRIGQVGLGRPLSDASSWETNSRLPERIERVVGAKEHGSHSRPEPEAPVAVEGLVAIHVLRRRKLISLFGGGAIKELGRAVEIEGIEPGTCNPTLKGVDWRGQNQACASGEFGIPAGVEHSKGARPGKKGEFLCEVTRVEGAEGTGGTRFANERVTVIVGGFVLFVSYRHINVARWQSKLCESPALIQLNARLEHGWDMRQHSGESPAAYALSQEVLKERNKGDGDKPWWQSNKADCDDSHVEVEDDRRAIIIQRIKSNEGEHRHSKEKLNGVLYLAWWPPCTRKFGPLKNRKPGGSAFGLPVLCRSVTEIKLDD
ncbi:hypothetical protein BKA70DRAFT_1241837 [Coprinopsis sp. MPI-PUGE-AT-0042]|nr:hypothetical protein BKA70DRAFT_1241837 [Coprinopsis sp. MPI-PUGE-AT-0042]